jgi:hypothetical protein
MEKLNSSADSTVWWLSPDGMLSRERGKCPWVKAEHRQLEVEEGRWVIVSLGERIKGVGVMVEAPKMVVICCNDHNPVSVKT